MHTRQIWWRMKQSKLKDNFSPVICVMWQNHIHHIYVYITNTNTSYIQIIDLLILWCLDFGVTIYFFLVDIVSSVGLLVLSKILWLPLLPPWTLPLSLWYLTFCYSIGRKILSSAIFLQPHWYIQFVVHNHRVLIYMFVSIVHLSNFQ